jgi:neutral ceramidase
MPLVEGRRDMHHAGWGRAEIAVEPDGYAMFGYGMWNHRARGRQTPLYARAFCVGEGARRLIFCCADLGSISFAVREGVCEALRQRLGADFDEEALVLTCTHTHSGPGGCSHEALYNVVTPGFVTPHYRAVVNAVSDAIDRAWKSAAPTEITLSAAAFDDPVPVAWNRSLRAYNRNPDVERRGESERHLAMNRTMHVLGFRRGGSAQALLSLFGVHATCIGNKLTNYDGDNKGYAAAHAEQALHAAGAADPVAIFAQATAGDISPHYHGPDDWERRKRIRGAAEVAYAQRNGEAQSRLALSMLAEQPGETIGAGLDAIFGYADFTAIRAEPRFANGADDAYTSEPCHGVSFFAGTPVDGRGMPPALAALSRLIAGVLRRRLARLEQMPQPERDYVRRLYAAQGAKAILLEAGRKTILGRPLAALALPDFLDPSTAEMKRQARSGGEAETEREPFANAASRTDRDLFRLLEMPADDLVVVRVAGTRRDPVGEARVQLGASALEEAAVGGVANEDVVEAQHGLAEEPATVGLDQLAAPQRFEAGVEIERVERQQLGDGARRDRGAAARPSAGRRSPAPPASPAPTRRACGGRRRRSPPAMPANRREAPQYRRRCGRVRRLRGPRLRAPGAAGRRSRRPRRLPPRAGRGGLLAAPRRPARRWRHRRRRSRR